MAELGLDGAGFKSGFRQAKGFAEGMSHELKNVIIGAIGIGTVEEAMRRTVDTAHELADASKRLAVAPEMLQVLRQAAKNANVDMEKLADSFEKISIARQKALIPGEEGLQARRAFGAAGINLDQIRAMGAAQLFMGPLSALARNRNPEQIGIIFRELGIKAFGGLIPVLKTNFDELGQHMKDLGAIMDTKTIAELEIFSNEVSVISKVITAQLGPVLIRFAETAYQALLKLGAGIAKGGAYVGGMVGSQGVIGTVTSFLSAAVHSIAHNLGFLSDEQFDAKMRELIPKSAVQNMDEDPAAFWHKLQTDFEKFLKNLNEEVERLNHPTPGTLDDGTIAPKLPRKALVEQTDSLVRIGNFLGGNDRVINRLAEKQVYWLEKIHQSINRNGVIVPGRTQVDSGFPSMMMGPHYPQN